MKRLILLSAIMLAGCSTVNQAVDAYLMKYDANEYKLATDIRTKASYAKNSCSDPVISKKNADSISYMTVTLKNYSEHLPHNKPVQEASVKLNEITH